jgi:hypothetical protein
MTRPNWPPAPAMLTPLPVHGYSRWDPQRPGCVAGREPRHINFQQPYMHNCTHAHARIVKCSTEIAAAGPVRWHPGCHAQEAVISAPDPVCLCQGFRHEGQAAHQSDGRPVGQLQGELMQSRSIHPECDVASWRAQCVGKCMKPPAAVATVAWRAGPSIL